MVTLDIALEDRALTIETTVTATTSASVPLCFGFHPYLKIPGVPRAEWTLRPCRYGTCRWTTGASDRGQRELAGDARTAGRQGL